MYKLEKFSAHTIQFGREHHKYHTDGFKKYKIQQKKIIFDNVYLKKEC